ncbi:MAG: hypothetical protein ACR2OB_08900 [Solirubrobacteraceae bacterium]
MTSPAIFQVPGWRAIAERGGMAEPIAQAVTKVALTPMTTETAER